MHSCLITIREIELLRGSNINIDTVRIVSSNHRPRALFPGLCASDSTGDAQALQFFSPPVLLANCLTSSPVTPLYATTAGPVISNLASPVSFQAPRILLGYRQLLKVDLQSSDWYASHPRSSNSGPDPCYVRRSVVCSGSLEHASPGLL